MNFVPLKYTVLWSVGIVAISAVAWAEHESRIVGQGAPTVDVLSESTAWNISEHAGNLGHKQFNIRNTATWQLVRLARTSAAARKQVIQKMKTLSVHEDPEVAVRARQVIDALTEQPPPRLAVDGLSGAT